jgi:glycosyltransferase involved in cell wall biosynthesis
LSSIAVIIPTHNDSKSAAQAVASVLQQTRPADEIIVVDDGSQEDVRPALAPFSDRIRVIHQENQGVSNARNTGFRAANSDFIAFLDADDLWLPRKLELQLPKLEDNPEFALVYCDAIVDEEESGRQFHWLDQKPLADEGWILDALYQEFFILPSTMLCRKSILEELRGFDSWIRYAGDYDLCLRIALDHQIGCVREPLVRRRVRSTNMSSATWYKIAEDHLRIWDKINRTHPVESFPSSDFIRIKKAKTHLGLAYNYIELGRPGAARRNLLTSLRMDWNPRLLPRLMALYLFPTLMGHHGPRPPSHPVPPRFR